MVEATKFTPEKRAAFCARLEAGFSVTEGAKAVGINRRTAYKWRDSDAEFAAMWDAAIDQGTEVLEDEAIRRATAGKSDVLLIFLLKGRKPATYRDRLGVDFDNASPEQIDKAILNMPDDKLRGLIARLRGSTGSDS